VTGSRRQSFFCLATVPCPNLFHSVSRVLRYGILPLSVSRIFPLRSFINCFPLSSCLSFYLFLCLNFCLSFCLSFSKVFCKAVPTQGMTKSSWPPYLPRIRHTQLRTTLSCLQESLIFSVLSHLTNHAILNEASSVNKRHQNDELSVNPKDEIRLFGHQRLNFALPTWLL
jgi:hypothetical protein